MEEQRILAEIKSRGAKTVLLQMPEGLKQFSFRLARFIEEKASVDVFVSGDPCYGACDLALYQKERVSADLLVHIGHAEIPGEGPSDGVVYVEAHADVPIEKPLTDALKLLARERVIGLAASIQHIHLLGYARRFFESNGKTVSVGRPSGWLKYDGQVLGCDYGSIHAVKEEVDAVVVISGGDFHALGIPLATGKRTVVVDPFMQQARDLTPLAQKILRQRWMAITRFKEASKVAVVVGLKSAQMNLSLAKRLKKLLEETGKTCVMIGAIEVAPETLEQFSDVEAFVEIACPRISTDDRQRYRRAVLNPEEAMVAIGKKSWEDHLQGFTAETWH